MSAPGLMHVRRAPGTPNRAPVGCQHRPPTGSLRLPSETGGAARLRAPRPRQQRQAACRAIPKQPGHRDELKRADSRCESLIRVGIYPFGACDVTVVEYKARPPTGPAGLELVAWAMTHKRVAGHDTALIGSIRSPRLTFPQADRPWVGWVEG